jgi:hypothetical protein
MIGLLDPGECGGNQVIAETNALVPRRSIRCLLLRGGV